jgi:hypothetical protein
MVGLVWFCRDSIAVSDDSLACNTESSRETLEDLPDKKKP